MDEFVEEESLFEQFSDTAQPVKEGDMKTGEIEVAER